MSKSPEKAYVAKPPVQAAVSGPFFRKAETSRFFGAVENQAQEHRPFFPPSVQPKLEVSQPDDPQEKEADAVADQVMRMADTAPTHASGGAEEKPEEKLQRSALHGTTLPRIHRQAGMGGFASDQQSGADEGATWVQTKSEEERIHTFIARSARGPPSGTAPSAAADSMAATSSSKPSFESTLASSKGSGSPLPSDTRQTMESRFGADFSGVRIHTGSQAEQLSADISAQAFTHGNDIYFNSGRYNPTSAAGSHLLAHELTHTLQQGASQHLSLQRVEASSQRQAAVEMAKAEVGQVNAKETGPDGRRNGWQRLLEYFKTTFGEDRILPEGASFQPGSVNEAQIKTISTFNGDVMAGDGRTVLHNQDRDAMPSWCGIFAFWALNKGGIPLKKWRLGESFIPPEAAYPPAHQPKPGDIAWRREFSHYALVASSDGASVTSINGNTAGEDHVGGQIQEQTHPRDHWYAFFDPTLMMEGSLREPGSPENAGAAPVRSLKELRQKLFNVQRKAGSETETQAAEPSLPNTTQIAAKAGADVPAAAPEEKAELREEKREEKLHAKSDAGAGIKDVTGENTPEKEWANEAAPKTQVNREVMSSGAEKPQAEEDTSPRDAVQRSPLSLHNRGPPRAPPQPGLQIQSRVNRRIQRWSLSGAWDAVSGALSEAAAWVERGLDAAKEWLLGKVRDFVSAIPGYSMLCLILGEDPITGAPAPLTGASLLEAGLDLLPGGSMFRALFNRLGIYNDVADWLQGRIEDLSGLASGIGDRFARFWDGISLSDAGDPDGVLSRVADLLRGTINDIVGFVERSATTLLRMIKDVMVREIAAFVRARIPNLYPLLTVALGFDPETMQEVPRNGTNILNAFLEVSEDGREQCRQMLESGTFQRIVGWIDRGIAVFSTAYSMLRAAIAGIWDFVTIENLFSPVQTFTRIYNSFAAPIRLVTQFLIDAAIEILRVIKDAILGRLSAFARETRGYPLLCVIIGRDPFTGVAVPRTVHNVVRGFMSLMEGGEQQYEQLRESGAIDRIVAKVEAAVARLGMTPSAIIQLFIDLWNSFSIRDLARPLQCFRRIVETFGAPILRLIRFVIEIVLIAIEAILILMNFPFAIVSNILAKARQAWDLIKNDPAGFFKNILRAVKQGFIQFFDHIGTHLLNGVVGWLMAELRDAGVPVLSDFSLRGVIAWVLEVLGISMEKIWEKLAAHPRIGPERVARLRGMINTLEGIWTFIRDVQERGMAAIWDKIQEQLSNLWNTVLDAVKNWIMERIVNAVVTRLLSMLDPTGIMAVVNSVIAMYRAVQSFIRYITEMLQVVNSFVEGVLEIAQGNIQRAADALEGAMGRAMPIVIGFLANQVGLSGLGSRIAEMIERAREMVDQALTWLVNRAVDTGMALLDRAMAMGRSAVAAVRGWLGRLLGLEKRFPAEDGSNHRLYFQQRGSEATLMINPVPAGPFLAWVNGIVIAPNAPARATKLQNKQRAVQKAQEIDTAKARPAPDAAAEEQKARDITRMLEELSGFTGPLFAGQKPDCSSEANGGLVLSGLHDGKYGTHMQAATLTNIRMPAGSEPQVTLHESFNVINQRRNGRGSYYVLGHLLNHNLGGTGRDWRNLTPLTRDANSAHERNVETRVKSAVEAGNIVEYKVQPTYGRSARNSPNATIREIIQHEVHVPTALVCEATLITPASVGSTGETRAPLVPAGTRIDNSIGQADADYDLTGIRRETVYLDCGDASVIASIDGVSSTFAEKIRAAYEDKQDQDGTRFASFDALANYRFSDRREFTDNQKQTIRGFSDLGYVRLFQN